MRISVQRIGLLVLISIFCSIFVITSCLAEEIYLSGADDQGVVFSSSVSGIYRFTITGGAFSPHASDDVPRYYWANSIHIFNNSQPRWVYYPPPDERWGPDNFDFYLGDGIKYTSSSAAAAAGVGQFVDVPIDAGNYVSLILPSSLGHYSEMRGGMSVLISKLPPPALVIQFDESLYTDINNLKELQISDPSANTDPFAVDKIIGVPILSIDAEANENKILDTLSLDLIETDDNSGVFTGTFSTTADQVLSNEDTLFVTDVHQGVFQAQYSGESNESIYQFYLSVFYETNGPFILVEDRTEQGEKWGEGVRTYLNVTVYEGDRTCEDAEIYTSENLINPIGITDYQGFLTTIYDISDDSDMEPISIIAKKGGKQGINESVDLYDRFYVDSIVHEITPSDIWAVEIHQAGRVLAEEFDFVNHPIKFTFNIVTTLMGYSSNNAFKFISAFSDEELIYSFVDLFWNDVDFTKGGTLKAEIYKYQNDVMDLTTVHLLKLSVEGGGTPIPEKNIWVEEWNHQPNLDNKHNLLMWWNSPVVPWITAPDGSTVGYNPQNGEVALNFPAILNVQGSEPLYVFIPHADIGEYKIHVIGTGTGEYTFTVKKFNLEGNFESSTTITGTTIKNKIDRFLVQVPESGDIIILPQDPITLLIVPLPGYSDPPTDPDGDGIYEDLNANGRLDFSDIVLYFNQMTWISNNEPIAAFDLNGNGRIDFADIVALFNEI